MGRLTTVLDRTTYQAHERTIGPFRITRASRYVGIGVDRSGWTDPNQALMVRVEISPEGIDREGAWHLWFEFSCRGGADVDPATGKPAPFSGVLPPVSPPVGALVRAKIRTNGVMIKKDLILIEDTD